jgi:hypothetical protein
VDGKFYLTKQIENMPIYIPNRLSITGKFGEKWLIIVLVILMERTYICNFQPFLLRKSGMAQMKKW